MSVVDILQPCVTFNKDYTHEFFQKNIYYLPDDYDRANRETAFKKSLEWDLKKIPLGIIYESDRPSYESQLPQLAEKPLIDKSLGREGINDLFHHFS